MCVLLLMRLINMWDSTTKDTKIVFLYTISEEEIYTNIPEGIEEVTEEHYM